MRFVRNPFSKVLGGLGERVSTSVFGGCETVGEGSLSCFVDVFCSVESCSFIQCQLDWTFLLQVVCNEQAALWISMHAFVCEEAEALLSCICLLATSWRNCSQRPCLDINCLSCLFCVRCCSFLKATAMSIVQYRFYYTDHITSELSISDLCNYQVTLQEM